MYRCQECGGLSFSGIIDPSTGRLLCRDCYTRTDYYIAYQERLQRERLHQQDRAEVEALVENLKTEWGWKR